MFFASESLMRRAHARSNNGKIVLAILEAHKNRELYYSNNDNGRFSRNKNLAHSATANHYFVH